MVSELLSTTYSLPLCLGLACDAAAGGSFVGGAQLIYSVLASIPDKSRRILVQRTPAGRMPKSDSNTEISFGEAAANLESQPLKKGANASQAVRPVPRCCIGS